MIGKKGKQRVIFLIILIFGACFVSISVTTEASANYFALLELKARYVSDLKRNKKESLEQVKLIFLPRKFEGVSKSIRPLLNPQGTDYPPSRNELTGTAVQLKVEEARKRMMYHTSL